jgi:hypothetical protein
MTSHIVRKATKCRDLIPAEWTKCEGNARVTTSSLIFFAIQNLGLKSSTSTVWYSTSFNPVVSRPYIMYFRSSRPKPSSLTFKNLLRLGRLESYHLETRFALRPALKLSRVRALPLALCYIAGSVS